MSSQRLVELCIPRLPEKLQLFVHGPQDKHVSQQLVESGIWEPYETSLMQALLRSGDVFIDIGANIGYFTVVAASLVGPAGQVFSFEPDPENYRLLMENTDYNGLSDWVSAFQVGLAQHDSMGTLYLSENNLGDHQIYPGEGARPEVEVTLRNGSRILNRCLQDLKKNQIDLIKIDTQGSEFAVVDGLMEIIRQVSSIPTILVELTPFSLQGAGSSGRELIELLATLEQPMWIVDHIEHALVQSSAYELARWCDNVDACEGDQGFMNILVGSRPARIAGHT